MGNQSLYPKRLIFSSTVIQDTPYHLEGVIDNEFLEDCVEEDRLYFHSPIRYDFWCERSGRGFIFQGRTQVLIHGYCDRCLKEFEYELLTDNICIFKEGLEDREIDLTDDLHEDIVLSLPVRLLCREDCVGLCPHCGANLNDEQCGCNQKVEEKRESPWDQLDELQL